MLRYNNIESSEPRMKEASVPFSSASIVAPLPASPQFFHPALPGEDACGICGEEIRPTDTDYATNRRIAVDFPVNDSDEFEAVVHGGVASSDYENLTFDVYGDPTNDPLSEQINIAVPGTQFIYMRTTQSSNTVPAKNTAIFKFNRTKGTQTNS